MSNIRKPDKQWLREWLSARSFPEDEPEEPSGDSPARARSRLAPGKLEPTVAAAAIRPPGEAAALKQLLACVRKPGSHSSGAGFSVTVSKALPAAKPATIRRGEIRQLSPSLPLNARRPVYVLILDETPGDGGRLLVAPFGRLRTPAFDGELATGLDDDDLRVLCVWDAESVLPGVLENSWLLGEREEALAADAAALLRAQRLGSAIPAALAARIGPPMGGPDDPRNDYVNSAGGSLGPLRNFSPLPFDQADVAAALRGATEMSLATTPRLASHRAVGAQHGYDILGEGDLRMRVGFGAGPWEVEFTIVGSDGLATGQLDGSLLYGASGETAAVYMGSCFLPTAAVRGGFALADPDGAVRLLSRPQIA